MGPRPFFRYQVVLALLLPFLGLLAPSGLDAAPAVSITNLPPYGSFNPLSGTVSGTPVASNAIAVFIYVPGYGWVSKPTCAQPLTTIQQDGTWTASITTGGSDQLATRVAALLVSTNYNQSCVNGAAYLPTNVFAQALASAIVTRPSPGVRFLTFSGYDWWLKTSSGTTVGPGPNYFSDSTNNVWLDAQGQLHLRITHVTNTWQCAELISARTFGYGSYRFEVAANINTIDPNVVLGLFTWSDDPVFADREIDIECSRWGNASDLNNAQFVVQPYNLTGHLARYDTPAVDNNSTHLFTWQSGEVKFQSQPGPFVPNPARFQVITNWTYSLTTPVTGDENVHINLWLMNGLPPTDNSEHEFVLKNFRFVPLGSPSPPKFFNPKHFSKSFSFSLQTEMDRLYEIDSSSDLSSWTSEATILATNSSVSVGFTKLSTTRQFYRAFAVP